MHDVVKKMKFHTEDHMKSSRYENGMKIMKEIDGEAGEKVLELLKPVSSDLARLIIEYSFGEIYSRKGLLLKEKEIAVVAALTAAGNAQPQLTVHINGALNTGCTLEEVKEIILHITGYAGFPCAINAMNIFREVILARTKKGIIDAKGVPALDNISIDRYHRGAAELESIFPGQTERLNKSLGSIAPDLVRYIVEFGYGDIYSRGVISKRERQIATIAALTVLGTASEQLYFHILAGFNVGLSKAEIIEIMILMSVYAGFPAAINGITTLKRALDRNNT
jgi:4-carboxymuconolactone decarboxylase